MAITKHKDEAAAMNTALWMAAGVLAVAFVATGLMKLTQSKAVLTTKVGWVEDYSPAQIKAIGAVEILGAMGLIVPGLLGVATALVPLAALGLALIMVGAAVTHIRRGERALLVLNLVLFALAVFVAWGRSGPYPL